MSDEFGQVLLIMSFLGRLDEEMSSAFDIDKAVVKTYNFLEILEITVPGLEEKATRLMVSRHSDPIPLGHKVSK